MISIGYNCIEKFLAKFLASCPYIVKFTIVRTRYLGAEDIIDKARFLMRSRSSQIYI